MEEERQFECLHCDYKAKHKNNLDDHERYMHLGTRCVWPGCNLTTANELSLRKHIRAVHILDRPAGVQAPDGSNKAGYQCSWPTCNNSFVLLKSAVRCSHFHFYDEIKEKAMGNTIIGMQNPEDDTTANDSHNYPSEHAWYIIYDNDYEEPLRLPPLRPRLSTFDRWVSGDAFGVNCEPGS